MWHAPRFVGTSQVKTLSIYWRDTALSLREHFFLSHGYMFLLRAGGYKGAYYWRLSTGRIKKAYRSIIGGKTICLLGGLIVKNRAPKKVE